MPFTSFIKIAINAFIILLVLQSCKTNAKRNLPANFKYEVFKDSIKAEIYDTSGDNSNIFDSTLFNPGIDSVDALLLPIDSLWHSNIALMEHADTLHKAGKRIANYSPEELEVLKENVKVLDSFFTKRNAAEHLPCRQKDCLVYAEIIKSTQILYLYLDATLIDSFAVSTGIKKYETPKLDVRPTGPLLKKYTSKKFPGGNYEGLGNMPYAVFVRGGYAIHGTTIGNFAKLGSKASHGCIRLHPVNAKIFYELVNRIGLQNTWVTIKDSL